jgi:hypothetical protein
MRARTVGLEMLLRAVLLKNQNAVVAVLFTAIFIWN